jgi:uncharacterized membrane protein
MLFNDFQLIFKIKHFILLNLIFSTQAAYAAPIIMMSQNRHDANDRLQAQEDYQTKREAKITAILLG